MTHSDPTAEKSKEEILDAVYLHGVREGDKPGSRLDITALPDDELTIATALKLLNKKDANIKAALEEKDKEIAILKAVRGPIDAELADCRKEIEGLRKELVATRHDYETADKNWIDSQARNERLEGALKEISVAPGGGPGKRIAIQALSDGKGTV